MQMMKREHRFETQMTTYSLLSIFFLNFVDKYQEIIDDPKYIPITIV